MDILDPAKTVWGTRLVDAFPKATDRLSAVAGGLLWSSPATRSKSPAGCSRAAREGTAGAGRNALRSAELSRVGRADEPSRYAADPRDADSRRSAGSWFEGTMLVRPCTIGTSSRRSPIAVLELTPEACTNTAAATRSTPWPKRSRGYLASGCDPLGHPSHPLPPAPHIRADRTPDVVQMDHRREGEQYEGHNERERHRPHGVVALAAPGERERRGSESIRA